MGQVILREKCCHELQQPYRMQTDADGALQGEERSSANWVSETASSIFKPQDEDVVTIGMFMEES